MVDQSQRKSIESEKRNLSPIQSQPIPTEISIIFGDRNERNEPVVDFSNVTVDVDQTNKQILVDVSMSMPQDLHPNQSVNTATYSPITIQDTFIKSPEHSRVTRNSINAMKSSTEIDNKCYKSIEVAKNESIKINTTPAVQHTSFDHDRTPIGVIRLRKVTPKIETPELNISDDEAYEVVVVNKSRHSRVCADHSVTVNSTTADVEDNALASYYSEMPKNPEIASKSTARVHPFQFSPRIILNRINSIDEHQESVSIEEPPTKTLIIKQKRKASKARTKNGMYKKIVY